MAEPQKLSGILLGQQDATVRIKLERKLAQGEQVTFTLALLDPWRDKELVAIAEASLGQGGDEAELPVQRLKDGLVLAYAGDGFAKILLRWKESVSSSAAGTAQLAIAAKPYAFPRSRFVLSPPPPPPPPP